MYRLFVQTHKHMCIYIYLYICLCIKTQTYIHVYEDREREIQTHKCVYIYLYILSFRKQTFVYRFLCFVVIVVFARKPVFIKNVCKTLVGIPPAAPKNKKYIENYEKRWVEQPCWEACGWRAGMGDMSSQQVGGAWSMNLGCASFRRAISGNHAVFVLRRTHCTHPHSHMVTS